jgi:dephospho-CoA kinase
VVIGLTGNIATGKSMVLAYLAGLGAATIDADQVAHQVMEPGEPAYQAIVELFGPDIAPGGGPIDRRRLGEIVFADAQALAQLEEIVHPAVFVRIKELVDKTEAAVVVIEAIKLLEAGLSVQLCDSIWVVTAPREQQIRRLMASRGLSRQDAELRIDAQPSQELKIAQADVVIDNGGSREDTRAQVMRAWEALVMAQAWAAGQPT